MTLQRLSSSCRGDHHTAPCMVGGPADPRQVHQPRPSPMPSAWPAPTSRPRSLPSPARIATKITSKPRSAALPTVRPGAGQVGDSRGRETSPALPPVLGQRAYAPFAVEISSSAAFVASVAQVSLPERPPTATTSRSVPPVAGDDPVNESDPTGLDAELSSLGWTAWATGPPCPNGQVVVPPPPPTPPPPPPTAAPTTATATLDSAQWNQGIPTPSGCGVPSVSPAHFTEGFLIMAVSK